MFTLKYKALLYIGSTEIAVVRRVVFFIVMLFLSGLTAIPIDPEYRKKDFLYKQRQYTWLSWNASDGYVKKELKSSTQKFLY